MNDEKDTPVSVGIRTRAHAKTFRFECRIPPVGSITVEGRNEWLAEGAGPAIGELFGQLCRTAEKLAPESFAAARPRLLAAWEKATERFAAGEKKILVEA